MDSFGTEEFMDLFMDNVSSCSSSSGDESEDDSSKEVSESGIGEKRDDASCSSNIIKEITGDDFDNKEFKSSEEAYELYVKYARCVSFGVRKSDAVRDDEGKFIRRKFVCNRAGVRDKKYYESVDRKRPHKPETRTNCRAKLCVYHEQSSCRWKVSKFDEEHNHDLIPLRFVHLIPNHRRMSEADKAQVDSMHRQGIATSQIMGLLAGQAGGFEGVGFSKKDLYNYIDRKRSARINDGDANAAIGYLRGKADSEPMTVARYSATDDGRLGNLFWADGLSRVDFQYFGDVLAFDATYKKNKYNRPLVIFSGTNHHRQTCIFGFALLADESAETYKWLLKQFVEVMTGKEPSVVVTDGDKAMRKAIRAYFPKATHRLCAWHLEKNCTSNISNSDFCDAFKDCIYANFDCDEFEEYWHDMVEKYELQDNRWVEKAYKTREMWANAYLRDKFCAGYRTTSRCEGINSFLKKFLKSKHSILELVQNVERAVRVCRNNELVAQFKSIYREPVLTTGLESIERAAANVYTREIFKDVKKQMENVISLYVGGRERVGTTVVYKVCKYRKRGRQYTVLFDTNLDQYECKCRMWNGSGIVCSHMFCVMRHEEIEEIPQALILRRWCKNAKTYDDADGNQAEEDSEKVRLLRYGALCAASQWMSYLGSKKLVHFRKTMDEISRISRELEHKCGLSESGAVPESKGNVGDPPICKTKGAPSGVKGARKKRRCSSCSLVGHTKRNCPTIKGRKVHGYEEDCTFPVDTDDDGDSNCGANDKGNQDIAESSGSKKRCNEVDEALKDCGGGDMHPQLQAVDPSKVFFGGPQINQYYGPQFFPAANQLISPNGFNCPPHHIAGECASQPLCSGFHGADYAGLAQQQYVVRPGHQWYLQVLQQMQRHEGGSG